MHLESLRLIFKNKLKLGFFFKPSRRPFSTYQIGASRFGARLRLLPHIPPNVNADQLWLQLLPKDKRLSGNHVLGHSEFFSAICAWLVLVCVLFNRSAFFSDKC